MTHITVLLANNNTILAKTKIQAGQFWIFRANASGKKAVILC